MDLNLIKNWLEMVVSIVLGKRKQPKQQTVEPQKSNLGKPKLVPTVGQELIKALEEIVETENKRKPILFLNDLLSSSGKYPERITHIECSEEVKAHALALLEKVNAFLDELGITEATVSSGFRPSEVNNATPNAAKKSLHKVGKAIDLLDDTAGTLATLVYNNQELLKKHGLALEHPGWTVGWVHLQSELPKSKNIVFIPSSAPPTRQFPK